MANYGSFVYGSGQVYGTQIELQNIEVLSLKSILLEFTDELVVDDVYKNPESYIIDVVTGAGPVRVKRVLGINGTASRTIILVTETMTRGTRYRVTSLGLNGRDGTSGSASGDFIARETKQDSTARSCPRHFDPRPESLISSVLAATSREDDLIGGARDDTFEFGSILIPGRPPPPVATIDLAITNTLCPNSPPHGTYQEATRIVIFVDGVPKGEATLDTPVIGEWQASLPSGLVHNTPVELKAAVVGDGGFVEVVESSVNVDLQVIPGTLDSHTDPDTDTNPITFFGSGADPGATVSVIEFPGFSYSDSAVVDGLGNWNMGAETLPTGAAFYIFSITDACGNTAAVAAINLTVS